MILGMFAVGLVLAILILSLERPVVGEAEGESEHQQPAENLGSHGGQLLTNGPIALEILLSEKAVNRIFRFIGTKTTGYCRHKSVN